MTPYVKPEMHFPKHPFSYWGPDLLGEFQEVFYWELVGPLVENLFESMFWDGRWRDDGWWMKIWYAVRNMYLYDIHYWNMKYSMRPLPKPANYTKEKQELLHSAEFCSQMESSTTASNPKESRKHLEDWSQFSRAFSILAKQIGCLGDLESMSNNCPTLLKASHGHKYHYISHFPVRSMQLYAFFLGIWHGMIASSCNLLGDVSTTLGP